MNNRIKKIRKTLELTQQEFADKIGSVQNTITGYESGRRNPSDSVINNICKTFNVNENWLRTGNGSMFVEIPEEDEIMKHVGSLLRNEKDIVAKAVIGFITEYQKLNPTNKAIIRDLLKSTFNHIKE